jgi:DNA-binding NtrC family response regulator
MMDKPAVLIVDDEDGIRKTLTVILNENDYDADSAKNGQEAIMKANEKFYNIALIDIVLPDMNGVELLTKIRETKPKMRKIIMTGNPSVQNAVGALNNGADAYIMKPLHIEKMLTTVEEQLKKQREERETAIQHFERGRLRGRIDVLGRESQALDI